MRPLAWHCSWQLQSAPLHLISNNAGYVTSAFSQQPTINNQQNVVFNKDPGVENNARHGLSSVAAFLEPTWHALGA